MSKIADETRTQCLELQRLVLDFCLRYRRTQLDPKLTKLLLLLEGVVLV